MLEGNSQISGVRLYASSGTSPGRDGPYGVVLFLSLLRLPAGRQGSRNPGFPVKTGT